MSNPELFKSFTAGGAINAYRIVKLSTATTAVAAAAATDSLIGVSADLTVASGERVDVLLEGIAFVEAGAAVTIGAQVTSDSVGRCVTAAPAAGVNNRVIGIAMEDASAAGDVIRVLLSPCTLQG
jgi:hypothetical protein